MSLRCSLCFATPWVPFICCFILFCIKSTITDSGDWEFCIHCLSFVLFRSMNANEWDSSFSFCSSPVVTIAWLSNINLARNDKQMLHCISLSSCGGMSQWGADVVEVYIILGTKSISWLWHKWSLGGEQNAQRKQRHYNIITESFATPLHISDHPVFRVISYVVVVGGFLYLLYGYSAKSNALGMFCAGLLTRRIPFLAHHFTVRSYRIIL